MTETKWTPGPWVGDKKVIGEIYTKTGDYIARTYFRPTTQEHEANAHLIAAAPDLYQHLSDLHEACVEFGMTGGNTELIPKALAKARGESND